MGFGGPHAGFMSVRDKYKRSLPGRLIGLTKDQQGRQCYRLALQTREQHIRRERATSNICTAQALLAMIAKGLKIKNDNFFDTLVVNVQDAIKVHKRAEDFEINLRHISKNYVGVSIDETTTKDDLDVIINLFEQESLSNNDLKNSWPKALDRKTKFLTQEVFNSYHSETKILRYIRNLSD